MVKEPDQAYLRRALQRIGERAHEAAEQNHDTKAAEFASRGTYQSSMMMQAAVAAREQALEHAVSAMSRSAFEILGASDEAADVLRQELRALRDRLSNTLVEFFRKQAKWAPPDLAETFGSSFLARADALIEATLDDFLHGMLQGARFRPDAVAGVMTVVSNSPGAVVQSGSGNVQAHISTAVAGNLRGELAAFAQSAEVNALSPDDRQAVLDIVEVLDVELQETEPDVGKLRRWAERLKALAAQFGIAVAANVFTSALLSALPN